MASGKTPTWKFDTLMSITSSFPTLLLSSLLEDLPTNDPRTATRLSSPSSSYPTQFYIHLGGNSSSPLQVKWGSLLFGILPINSFYVSSSLPPDSLSLSLSLFHGKWFSIEKDCKVSMLKCFETMFNSSQKPTIGDLFGLLIVFSTREFGFCLGSVKREKGDGFKRRCWYELGPLYL